MEAKQITKEDIIVSLCKQRTDCKENPLKEGDICRFISTGSVSGISLHFVGDGKGTYKTKNFRLATEKEIEHYFKGIKNINQIPDIINQYSIY